MKWVSRADTCTHYAVYHCPQFYRYRVANDVTGFSMGWNRYENLFSRATIGVAVVAPRAGDGADPGGATRHVHVCEG